MGRQAAASDSCCCICLDPYHNAAAVVQLPCKHELCETCCRAQQINNCPLCRAPVAQPLEQKQQQRQRNQQQLSRRPQQCASHALTGGL